MRAVWARIGHRPEVPFVFRNNTLAFAWDLKFGQGMGRTGDLLWLNAEALHAVVDNNIFEFADNHAIRLDANPRNVVLTNNVFAHNLWADVFRTAGNLVIDGKNFGSMRELGFKQLEGNVLMIPGLPIEQQWFDVYLNRTATVPGKVQMDDWNKVREILGQPVIATGGTPGTGMAPAYDWKQALRLFPKNPECKAGARPVKLEVRFEGVARPEPQRREYLETSWDVAASAAEWAKLDGKRVMLKVAIKSGDAQWQLPDATKEAHSAWQVGGPEAGGSAGLPMRVYVPRGTRVERMFRQARGYTTGNATEIHVVKGIARRDRQMVVEAVERAD
jgi:hypothetical protein